MSEIRGKKGFETPSKEDLQNYLKQGKKSVDRMKAGKKPILIKPKSSVSLKIISIIALIVISSTLFISSSLLTNLTSIYNNNNNTNVNSSETTTSLFQSTTTTLVKPFENLGTSMQEIAALVHEMVPSDRLIIASEVINGTINASKIVNTSEILDIVWILSQFEKDSEWWLLGRELSFEVFKVWNQSVLFFEPLEVQLRALRCLLAYPANEIPLEPSNMTIFENTTDLLWRNISSHYNSTSGHLYSVINESKIFTPNYISLLDILSKKSNHPNLNITESTFSFIDKILNVLDNLTSITTGLPGDIYPNLTYISPIYQNRYQNELIITLNTISDIIGPSTLLELLTSRLTQFVDNNFLQQDWSVGSYYNRSSNTLDSKRMLVDQLFYIRANVKREKINFANYSIESIFDSFVTSNTSFFTSFENPDTQTLIDQLHILLAFQEYLELESRLKTTSKTKESAAPWSIGIFILTILLIPIRRRKLKKRKN